MYSGLTRRIIIRAQNNVLHSKFGANVHNTALMLPITISNRYNRYQSTESSTSAVEYKLTHPRRKPPPLPNFAPPNSSAKEAVNNILYNNSLSPPSSPKKHILNCFVQNEPGVLSRVSGILAARGFNIDSLVVAKTEVADLSRMTIVLREKDDVIEQARRQLADLVPVWAVIDYTNKSIVQRELLLVKVSFLGPEHLHEQLIRREENDEEFNPEANLEAEIPDVDPPIVDDQTILSPSAILRRKFAHLRALTDLSKLFGAHLLDVANDSVVIELAAKPTRLDAFIKLIKPFGILELARSGTMALPRTPLDLEKEVVEEDSEDNGVDLTMLPPG